jgi:hypothetical protein
MQPRVTQGVVTQAAPSADRPQARARVLLPDDVRNLIRQGDRADLFHHADEHDARHAVTGKACPPIPWCAAQIPETAST